ncbi:hypothetical protein I5M27_14605 [Adhaeribacter sp. BT258]|uniref:Outer membrane protein beta-barrel domain-containing protein n=1 Tax=Adhaeribacter terrigena TaxID=2793070 RepID=A0ABS1C499_9BACT|nr:hypothetical protein [Adhaeribacter terrigena]MBK0404224.1 hypothetical protein [Adhaeribacter terrigena]
MRTFFLFLTAGIFATNVAFGQSTTAAPDSAAIKPAQTSRRVTYSQQTASEKVQNRHNPRITRVKINPLLILSGDMPVYVEHELKKNLSAEISVGSTYDNVLSDILESASQPDLSITKEGLNSYSFSAALRHYPSVEGSALQGYYFSPEVRFRDYRSLVTKVGGEDVNLKQGRQILDGKLVIGYINQTSDRIFFDFYGGIGMRYKFYKDRIENYSVIYDPATGQTSTHLKLNDELRRGLLLSLGFKLGFAF